MKRAVLFVVTLSALSFGAAKKKSVEERYTAPMKGSGYAVTVHAPQLLKVGEAAEAKVEIQTVGSGELARVTKVPVEVSADKSVVMEPCKAPEYTSPGHLILRCGLKFTKPGTHELVLGVPVKLAQGKQFLVAVPLSVTGELESATDAGR